MLVPGEVISAIINGTDELLARMREMGVGIYATGGETADVGDLVRTIIVDSTVTCRMKRSDVINNANIRPGDIIVGLSSSGQATYEDCYNGGMGSNGLTSARHDVFAKYLAEKYPESYDHTVPDELVYSGHYHLDDTVEGAPVTASSAYLINFVLRYTEWYTALEEPKPKCSTLSETTVMSLRTICSQFLLSSGS